MSERPQLFVCHGDAAGPRIHPCRRVQEALQRRGVPYDKVIAGPDHPIPFLRKGSRDEPHASTGERHLPALKLPDGAGAEQQDSVPPPGARKRAIVRGRRRASDLPCAP